MTGESTARKIEDLDAPALTYAEVKAIASGNPLVIEKAKVDAEVMRLSRLRAEHSEAQFSDRSRLRMMEQDVLRLDRHIAALEQDLAARPDTQGDRFEIVLAGKKFTERQAAGAALIYLVEDHRTDHLLGRTAPAVLGEFAGFKIEFRSTLADKMTLRGAAEYQANVSPSPVGIISSLEHAVRSIEEHVMRSRADLAQTRKNLTELSALSGKVFEHEERYRELVARQSELVEKLDITKNQASSQLAAESTGDVESVDTTPPETAVEGVTIQPAHAPPTREEPKFPELMTPKEFKAAGLGRANDVEVLRAARKRKPVSAISRGFRREVLCRIQ